MTGQLLSIDCTASCHHIPICHVEFPVPESPAHSRKTGTCPSRRRSYFLAASWTGLVLALRWHGRSWPDHKPRSRGDRESPNSAITQLAPQASERCMWAHMENPSSEPDRHGSSHMLSANSAESSVGWEHPRRRELPWVPTQTCLHPKQSTRSCIGASSARECIAWGWMFARQIEYVFCMD